MACQLHREREARRDVIGCEISLSQLRCSLPLARRTTADQMAAHRKLDRSRDYLCAGVLRDVHFFCVTNWRILGLKSLRNKL